MKTVFFPINDIIIDIIPNIVTITPSTNQVVMETWLPAERIIVLSCKPTRCRFHRPDNHCQPRIMVCCHSRVAASHDR